jgi:hypothetical protein
MHHHKSPMLAKKYGGIEKQANESNNNQKRKKIGSI